MTLQYLAEAKLNEVQVFKLPEDDTKVSKHVGVTHYIKRKYCDMFCTLVGYNTNNIKIYCTCIKILNINNSVCKDLKDLAFLQQKGPRLLRKRKLIESQDILK